MSSRPRPEYLGAVHAERFRDQSVVEAYRFRPAYPEETFAILASLLPATCRAVLDVGSGRGDIARRLVERVERVDALDFSLPMIEMGKTLPNGDHPDLHWINGSAEEAPLSPPYGLITAGQSLHWMDWDRVLPRFRAVLDPQGVLALVTIEGKLAWDDQVRPIIKRYSTNPTYHPFDLIAELTERQLFQKTGQQNTATVRLSASIEDFVASFHSTSSLSRDLLGEEAAIAFDNEIRAVVTGYAKDGILGGEFHANLVWGMPL